MLYKIWPTFSGQNEKKTFLRVLLCYLKQLDLYLAKCEFIENVFQSNCSEAVQNRIDWLIKRVCESWPISLAFTSYA